jgi:drug/metabolite transporter (DMT)-like permease
MWVAVLIFMTMLGSLGAVCLKKSTASLTGVVSLLWNPWFYLGGVLYVVSALMNIYLLRIMEYSVVLPLTAVTYIWTILFSKLIFGERISWMKILAVACIIAGVVFLAM